MITSDIPVSFWVLLGSFSLISSILAVATLANVVRLRNVRMSWKSGRMNGYPLFSTLFLGFSLLMLGIGLYKQFTGELAVISLYIILAGGWFITSYLASKRYITDHGIVKNVNDPSQTIAWHQIRDFVEQEQQNNTDFIFLYSESAGMISDNIVRLELKVPSRHVEHFKKIISHKLGRRISCYNIEGTKVE